MTNAEKYNHDAMTIQDLEERVAADMYELHNRFQNTDAVMIGNLIWKLMRKFREACRTAFEILGEE